MLVARNSEAVDADIKMLSRHDLNLFAGSIIHNIHFKLYGALFLGQYKAAMEAVQQFDEHIPEALIRVKSPPMADLYEGYYSLKYHAYIRFGKWQEILDLPPPGDTELYLVTTAIYHYARSLSYAALGDVEAALSVQKDFNTAV